MAYSKTVWNNDTVPDIDADNLNKIEQGIFDNDNNIGKNTDSTKKLNDKFDDLYAGFNAKLEKVDYNTAIDYYSGTSHIVPCAGYKTYYWKFNYTNICSIFIRNLPVNVDNSKQLSNTNYVWFLDSSMNRLSFSNQYLTYYSTTNYRSFSKNIINSSAVYLVATYPDGTEPDVEFLYFSGKRGIDIKKLYGFPQDSIVAGNNIFNKDNVFHGKIFAGSLISASDSNDDYLSYPIEIDPTKPIYSNMSNFYGNYFSSGYIAAVVWDANMTSAQATQFSDNINGLRGYNSPTKTNFSPKYLFIYYKKNSTFSIDDIYISYTPIRQYDLPQRSLCVNPLTVCNDIIKNNMDVEHVVNASGDYGRYASSNIPTKSLLQVLVATDIHGCQERFAEYIKYLNYMSCFDIGVDLGDIAAASGYSESADWFVAEMAKAKKKSIVALGNHEFGNSTSHTAAGTVDEIYTKWLASVSDYLVTTPDKTYYYYDFSTYKIRAIVLNNFDNPGTKDGSGDFVINTGYPVLGQTQVDWLISTLKSTPQNYHVVIFMHQYTDGYVKVDSNFTSATGAFDLSHRCYAEIIPDIINAWMNKGALVKTYNPLQYSNVLSNIEVNTDFSSDVANVFIGYITGHTHEDIVAHHDTYTSQLIFSFSATARDPWQNSSADLPRLMGTKAVDCITSVSINTSTRKILLARIGSNITRDLVDRTKAVFTY